MKKLITIIVCFLFICCRAQPPAIITIAKACSTSNLKKNLYYLASDNMEGRMMASHGDTLASLFVANEFKRANLLAPYSGSYFQSISANKKTITTSFNIGDKSYDRNDGWILYPSSKTALQNVPVIYNQFNDVSAVSNYISANDVKGKAITLTSAIIRTIILNNTVDSIEAFWKAKGIVAEIDFGTRTTRWLTKLKEHSFISDYETKLFETESNDGAIPEISLTADRMNDLLMADKIKLNTDGSFADSLQQPVILKNQVSCYYSQVLREVHAPNVIGILQGTDTSLPCIVLSAHHDHDGKNRDIIYYGAVDNASGTSVIIEIADMLSQAVKEGLRPKRTIVFASFTGEERGLLGSEYYVNHPVYSMQKTYGVLNIDMMGRVDTFYSDKRADSNYAYILVKDSAHNFRKDLYAANSSLTNIILDTHYEDPQYTQRRLQGSDQYPFYLKGVSFVRIDCGFCKDYHQPTDTPDKINYALLTKQTQLAFLTLWNLANE